MILAKILMKKIMFAVFIITMEMAGCQQGDNKLKLKVIDGTIEIDNGIVKARLAEGADYVSQDFFALSEGEWILVAESFRPDLPIPDTATQLFNTSLDPLHRFLVSENLKNISIEENNNDKIVVKITGDKNETSISQWIILERGKDYFHFEVEALLPGNPARLDYFLSTFTFNLDHAPFFIHTPTLKYDAEESGQTRFNILPAQDQVIGDRTFHSPAVILQEKGLFMALVPDLNAINQYAVISPDARRAIDIPKNKFSVPIEEDKYTMPTGLDLNVRSGLTKKPVITFGWMDNIIGHHIRYQRVNDSTMIRTLNNNKVRYAFDLFLGAGVDENSGYQRIASYQWERYGHPVFMNRPHLAMPFEEYFRIIDSVTFHPNEVDIPLEGYEDMGSSLQFEMDGLPAGGYRSAVPWWNDVMHNSTFWNNARDASGFFFWGDYLKKPELTDRARRIINFCLSAPRNKYGLFATLYNANSKKWGLGFSDPPHGENRFFLRESKSYDVPAMSKTAAHLLDYYSRCEKDERIIEYLRPYAEWCLTAINDRGAVPSYVTIDMEASPVLLYSAHPAATMWFLAGFYNVTNEVIYLDGAKKIAAFLEREILPEARWIDMEHYFSCGKKSLEFTRDVWQNQLARGNLANFWACEGFAALYDATGEDKYLKIGERAVDYVSFSQCIWEPHFIYTAFPFGGFTADNADNANMLDARQAEMVKPFLWYGKKLKRQDLLERGIAAARSSVVLINLPEHKKNNIYRHTNIYPYGLGPENIDHGGHPVSAMRTHPSWGEGSGVFTGLAEAMRACGGAYINTDKNLAVGVDGVRIDKCDIIGNELFIQLTSVLFDLNLPWEGAYRLDVVIEGKTRDNLNINVNGTKIHQKPDAEGRIRINILPDNTISEIKL